MTDWDAGRIAAWNRWLQTPDAEGYDGACNCVWCRGQRALFDAAYARGERWLSAAQSPNSYPLAALTADAAERPGSD
jgi:hypothetical protein